jgi:hypothetical protein
MHGLGAMDPANLEAQARAELGFSRRLEQPRRISPYPGFGGSGGYPVWYRDRRRRGQRRSQRRRRRRGGRRRSRGGDQVGPQAEEDVHVTKIEYFGTYLRYLPTNSTSPHCDNFPANPRSYPVGSQIPVTPNIAELVCFFPETL